jgi:CMP/dCMP kinase
LKRQLLITIDGPSGAGKSTISRLLAKKLSCLYLDTGALYRALAWKVLQAGIDAVDDRAVAVLCGQTAIRLHHGEETLRVLVDGKEVTERIRTEPIGLLASTLSAMPVVRSALLSVQRDAVKEGAVVAEGRDMGTVVFPGADFKFFLEADVEERVRRRHDELVLRGETVDYPSLRKDLMARDRQDRERTIAPLKVPEGAVIIDSTRRTVEEVVDAMVAVIQSR